MAEKEEPKKFTWEIKEDELNLVLETFNTRKPPIQHVRLESRDLFYYSTEFGCSIWQLKIEFNRQVHGITLFLVNKNLGHADDVHVQWSCSIDSFPLESPAKWKNFNKDKSEDSLVLNGPIEWTKLTKMTIKVNLLLHKINPPLITQKNRFNFWRTLFEDTTLSDFTIITNDQQNVLCHRMILAHASPIFKRMLTRDTKANEKSSSSASSSSSSFIEALDSKVELPFSALVVCFFFVFR